MSKLRAFLSASKKKVAVVAVATVGMVGQANAALDAAVTGAFTTMIGDAEALISQAWAPVLAITGGLVLITLFKKVFKNSFS